MKTVCVIGLGQIGLPTAHCIWQRGLKEGFDVCGYDKRKVQAPFETFTKEIPRCDVYVICVHDKTPEMPNVFDVCSKITNKEALICIESTLAVGTARRCAERFGFKRLVHIPHRYWAADLENHGVRQLRVIGALNPVSLSKAEKFYKVLDIPLYRVVSLEIAEAIKLAENAHRYVQVAFVEQLVLLCDMLDIPFKELKAGMETKWNVDLLEPRDGIKGSCLPKDLNFLISIGEMPLFKGARETDKKYVESISK